MPGEVLLVQNITREGPGLLEDLLKKDRAQLEKDWVEIQADYTKTGTLLFSNFLDLAGL